jgi:hypothetical protein
LQSLGEMGGARVKRAIEHRVRRSPADGFTRYHGANALAKIAEAGTAEKEASTTATNLWHLCCWIGILSRWLVIVFVRFRMMTDPSRSAEDQMARYPLWFERFLLFILVGLCSIRLLYVLFFHMNPGVLKLAVFAGMPLGRYILCSVMDPVVVLMTVRGIFKRKRWGWPLLLTYIPAAILLGRYDYGYWTTVMVISAGWVVVAIGARVLAHGLSARRVMAELPAMHDTVECPRLTKSLLTALVALNSTRLLLGVAVSTAIFRLVMAWGWDAVSMALGIIAAALSGVMDASIMFLVNKMALKVITRSRAGRAWLQHTVDILLSLILGGLCLYVCGLIVFSAIGEASNIAQVLVQAGGPLLLIAGLSAYPTILVWRGRTQEILRYYVIVTVVGYLIAQPLALVWSWVP